MELLDKLKIKPNNLSLYETAFSHTSYANEHNTQSYERLEFLGDAVLELLMSEYLYNSNKYDEGEMTKKRAHYVCETALWEYSLKLGLDNYLKLGNGELENGGKQSKAILSDIFESFLGALYLDQGFKTAEKFFKENIVPLIENHEVDFFDDYKSALQEYAQTDRKSIEYRVISETGPAHHKEFTAEVSIDGIVFGTGTAHSKKGAEQEAAKDALTKAQKGSVSWEEHMK